MTGIHSIADELSLRHSRTRESVRHWCARAATESSVIRVFEERTKADILATLIKVPIEVITDFRLRSEFEEWFEGQLNQLARAISRRNKTNERVQPGLKWGHAAKVLTLYLRDVVLHSRYFSDDEVSLIAPWLFVPVDSKVMARLRALGVRLPFRTIREIRTKPDFYFVQDLLAGNCADGIARVVFDDVWADRDPVT